jgi:hypothetical protein
MEVVLRQQLLVRLQPLGRCDHSTNLLRMYYLFFWPGFQLHAALRTAARTRKVSHVQHKIA